MKIKYVAQKQKSGCTVACMAMVTGASYGKVADQFQTDCDAKGIETKFVRDFLCEHGFSVIDVTTHSYRDARTNNSRMSRPFADAHVCIVQPFADSTVPHAVVMSRRGRVFDPDDPSRRSLSEYYFIVQVLGIFDERRKR
jgi:hypothetical protein